MITIREENIPWESKRDSKCPYWYITKHGIGPGTLPKDVKLGKYKDLDNYYTVIWIDRPLSTDELKYYDIYPETMNRTILTKLGYNYNDYVNSTTSIKHRNVINPFDESINIKEVRNAKFKTIKVLQGNYGYGWDDLYYFDDTPEGRKEQKDILKDYRENERGVPFRIITRKEPNPDYKAPKDRFSVYPVEWSYYTGRHNKTGETKKFTDMEDAIEYAKSLGTLCTLKDTVTGTNVQLDSSNDSFFNRNIDVFRNAVSKSVNESLKEEMYHHIDNGYSMVDISHTKPIDIIKGWKLTFDGTLDEVDNAFYFEEDEFGGFGGTQFFGVGNLTKGNENIQFKFWFNVNLYGDNEDETKIYVDIDNSIIDTDLFEYEIIDEETNIPVDEADDIMFDMDYEIGEAIYSVIQANVTGFGYSK